MSRPVVSVEGGSRQLPPSPGDSVSEARKALGWSQRELAERAGVSRPTVARIEAGQQVRVGTLNAVAAALGMHVEISVQQGRTDSKSKESRCSQPMSFGS